MREADRSSTTSGATASASPASGATSAASASSPYVCKIADKWLEVRATVRISGRGKAFEAITPEAMRNATTVTETNPTWKWLDHEPN